jgi:hypothetical protein
MNNDDASQQPDVVQWEYKDITIPLNLTERLTDKKVRPQVARVISAHLDDERRQGWQPDEPVDLSSLRARDRIQFRFRWFSGPTYLSATIRLKRPLLSS